MLSLPVVKGLESDRGRGKHYGFAKAGCLAQAQSKNAGDAGADDLEERGNEILQRIFCEAESKPFRRQTVPFYNANSSCARCSLSLCSPHTDTMGAEAVQRSRQDTSCSLLGFLFLLILALLLPSVSKGPFAVTAYSWPLPVEEELLGALTQLQAQRNCGSTLCSLLRFSSAFHFPHTPVKSVCKATKPPPRNHQPSPVSDLICLAAAACKQRSLTCMNLRTVMVLYPGRERKSPT